MTPKFKRILLKLSGEALAGPRGFGLDEDTLADISQVIKQACGLGVEIAVVVGEVISGGEEPGRIWTGRAPDHMGMLATVINSLALQSALEAAGVATRVQTAIEMRQIAEPYIRGKAISHLTKGRVVIFGCGTGNPFFSTDTGAALRAAEIEAEAILLAKKVDGVYDSRPEPEPGREKI